MSAKIPKKCMIKQLPPKDRYSVVKAETLSDNLKQMPVNHPPNDRRFTFKSETYIAPKTVAYASPKDSGSRPPLFNISVPAQHVQKTTRHSTALAITEDLKHKYLQSQPRVIVDGIGEGQLKVQSNSVY